MPPLPDLTPVQINLPPRIYHCEPGWHWSPLPLPDYDLWCVLNGEGEMRVEGERFALSAGRCFLMTPGLRPQATQHTVRRLEVFATHFTLPLSHALLPILGIRLFDREFLRTLAIRCEAAALRTDAAGKRQTHLLIEEMLWLLWDAHYTPAPPPADRRVGEIIARIRASPGKIWDVRAQADAAGLSRSQYTRRFHALTGKTPTEFVIETRIERAAQLLQETTMPLQAIAEVLGYRDLFFFSRQFKQKRGIAPSHLRQPLPWGAARDETAPLSSVKNGLNP